MDVTNSLGYIATVVSALMLIPQVLRTWKTKSVKDLSLGMCILGSLGSLLWLAYGILLVASPVIVANSIVFSCFLLLLTFKLKYK